MLRHWSAIAAALSLFAVPKVNPGHTCLWIANDL